MSEFEIEAIQYLNLISVGVWMTVAMILYQGTCKCRGRTAEVPA